MPHGVAAVMPLRRALSRPLIPDWDATLQTKYGHQEGAAPGYNPHRVAVGEEPATGGGRTAGLGVIPEQEAGALWDQHAARVRGLRYRG